MILAEKASPYFLLKVPNMLALLFYAEGCFIYAEVEIFQVKNKKLISTAGFRGSKLFQK